MLVQAIRHDEVERRAEEHLDAGAQVQIHERERHGQGSRDHAYEERQHHHGRDGHDVAGCDALLGGAPACASGGVDGFLGAHAALLSGGPVGPGWWKSGARRKARRARVFERTAFVSL